MKINKAYLRKLLMWIVVAVIAGLSIWIVTRPDSIYLGKPAERKPDFVFENPIVTEQKKGTKHWKLVAEKGELYKDRQEAYLYNVKAHIYVDDHDPVQIEAPRATMKIRDVNVFFYDCTITHRTDGLMTIKADTLTWYSNERLIKGTGDVTLRNEEITVVTDEIVSYLDTNTIVAKDRPNITIALKQQEHK